MLQHYQFLILLHVAVLWLPIKLMLGNVSNTNIKISNITKVVEEDDNVEVSLVHFEVALQSQSGCTELSR